MKKVIPQIDCSTCKTTNSMKPTKIGKFNGFLRFIGYLIAIPSVIGVFFAVLMLVGVGSATNEVMTAAQSDGEAAGAAIGATLGFGFSALLGGSALIGGVLGWILLMKKKVFKCVNCGFILERA